MKVNNEEENLVSNEEDIEIHDELDIDALDVIKKLYDKTLKDLASKTT